MNYLSQIHPEDLKGKRVLVRLDLNVPISEDGTVHDTDADRIKKSIPTLEFLRNAGAKTIIISHIGRDPKESLRPVCKYMAQLIPVAFLPALIGDEVKESLSHAIDGGMTMLENLRSNPGEEANDEAFAKELASYADIYVSDAFAVSHRAHASLVSLPKLLPSYAGLELEKEMENLSQSFNPPSPSILVLGGAKFETKLPVITKFLNIVDHIIIGGALANDFYKEMGYEIGLSLVDESANIKNIAENPKILVPKMVIVENATGREEKNADAVVMGDKIVDISPAGLEEYAGMFAEAKFILWNGPLGNYENGFTAGSKKVAEMISSASANGAQSIVGGGDSVALIEELGLGEKFGFLSTGGGAMLEYLANGTLPGIEALG